MRWEQVDLKKRLVYLPVTKNGEVRTVPLSDRAIGILEALPRSLDGRVFATIENSVRNGFAAACRDLESRTRVSTIYGAKPPLGSSSAVSVLSRSAPLRPIRRVNRPRLSSTP